jgi:hypothetical protein
VLANEEQAIPVIYIHESILKMMADYAHAPFKNIWRSKHERALILLDNVRSFAQINRSKIGFEDQMLKAFNSIKSDCIRLRTLRREIHKSYIAPESFVSSVHIATDWRSWIRAMDYFACYRKLLRDSEEQIKKYTMVSEARSKGPPIYHNFTELSISGYSTHSCIHNSKAINGEGGTRVICFVQESTPGCWTPYMPEIKRIQDSFTIHSRREQYAKCKVDVDKALEDIQRKSSDIWELEKNIIDLKKQESNERNIKKITGMQRGVIKLTEKKHAVSGGNRARWANMEQAKMCYERTTALKILDLSYDDLYSGLCQLMRKLSLGEKQLANILISLLEGSNTCNIPKLLTEVELKGLKVKDLVSPRDDTKTANVRISGLNLCMSLMSIMFITEPKHSLPMAISNLDALKAVSRGLIPLEVLFAPIEVALSHGNSMFRVGSRLDSLGSIMASGNNLRVVLDPSVEETRFIKEKSMPVTTLSLTEPNPSFSLGLMQGLKQLTNDIAWGDEEKTSMREAAFFFPFIKCVAIRTILENARW